jgi:hypothetical protein
MQYRQDRSVSNRVEEFIGVPCGRKRACFSFTVTYYACYDQVGIVEAAPYAWLTA